MAAVARAPYRETLYEFYHLQQIDRVDDLRVRGRSLHLAGLVALAFHEPKRLTDEHRSLLVAAGMTTPPDTARADALAFIAEIAKADAAGAWVPMKDGA